MFIDIKLKKEIDGKRNRWKNVDSYTNRIRTHIKQNDIVTLEELNKKFTHKIKSENQIHKDQHKIRSILHTMLKRGEIIRIHEGHYKQTSKIL